ncbi:hypothetical protein HGRIS_009089 [Hohenbuehelia grisea]|uniref:Conidiation-specific protein 6 n=1 Tax=Hohenbuehelia grisea TaxID=104357 RepID=A0ABR3J0I7_9AGAR
MSNTEHKNETQVKAGYKATIHNPQTSAAAKDKAARKLEEMGAGAEIPSDFSEVNNGADQSDMGDFIVEDEIYDGVTVDGKSKAGGSTKGRGNVLGGYKATLKNPNVGEEAKERARAILEENDALPDEQT